MSDTSKLLFRSSGLRPPTPHRPVREDTSSGRTRSWELSGARGPRFRPSTRHDTPSPCRGTRRGSRTSRGPQQSDFFVGTSRTDVTASTDDRTKSVVQVRPERGLEPGVRVRVCAGPHTCEPVSASYSYGASGARFRRSGPSRSVEGFPRGLTQQTSRPCPWAVGPKATLSTPTAEARTLVCPET